MNYKELNSAFKKINNWYDKKTKVLTVKTRPFNTSIVFSNLINRVLYNNGKILYVWGCTDKEQIKKRKREYYNILIDEQKKNHIGDDIKFITIDLLEEVYDDFDLVIFDDISIFSSISKNRLREAVEDVYWRSSKIIIYSSEYVFPIGSKMELVYLVDNVPIVEPRFVLTRIRLENDIPLALYEYLKWFKKNKKRALIIVSSEYMLNKIYNNYYNTLKNDDIRVVKYVKEQNFGFVEDILEGYNDSIFIVTNSIGNYINFIDDLNIVMLFSDNESFSYKEIIYLCGALRVSNEFLPEILLVSKEISDDMDKSKNITRGFNQSLWERKLLKK